MNKKKLAKVMIERYLSFREIVKNQTSMYGTPPNWTPLKPTFEHTMMLFDKLPGDKKRVKCKIGKKGDHYVHFTIELIHYTQKMMNNGKYYSDLLLKSFGIHHPKTRTLSGITKEIRKAYNARPDTLLTFSIMRSRLEEMILNLFFLYKANSLLKEKKWDELYKLIFKINYSGYQNDVNLKFRKGSRNLKKFLDFLISKDKKLHISELTRYVVKQKDLYDDYRPPIKDYKQEKLSKEQKFLMMKFQSQLKDQIEKDNYFSMKPITKYYDMLSLELHPNNLFTRNIITSIKEGSELALITKDHFAKLLECDDYICDTNEILYYQTIKLIHFFIDKINGSEKDLEILRGFNQSVENRLMKNCKLSFRMG